MKHIQAHGGYLQEERSEGIVRQQPVIWMLKLGLEDVPEFVEELNSKADADVCNETQEVELVFYPIFQQRFNSLREPNAIFYTVQELCWV